LRYLLPVNRTLIVKGPGTIRLIEGHASILGAPLESSAATVVQRSKQLPVESIDDVEIEISLGASGAITEVEGSSLPASWENALNSLEAMGKANVIIIGPSDVGKSSLCTYLMNELIKKRRRVKVLDADIGQADIGPPTTITSVIPAAPTPTLSRLEPDRIFFVGHNTPSFVQSQVLNGIRRLTKPESSGVTIINTDGWVRGSAAIPYKKRLISTVKPDLLIGIGPRNSLKPILEGAKAPQILVEPSRAILPRTRDERRQIRKSGYQRFLANGTLHTFKSHSSGVRVREGIKHAFSQGNPDLIGVVVGLLNEAGFVDQLGILENIHSDYLTVFSRAIHQPVRIEFGYVRISRDGSELGFLR